MGNAKGMQKKTESNRDNAGDFIGSLSVTQSCDPCMKSNISKTATDFCVNCNEFLCDTCKHPHCVYKPGKHKIVAIQDKWKMEDLGRCQEKTFMQPNCQETTKGMLLFI
ncbi:hypothetical protein DPMN_132457 [Dreissena polymorpha]|uniref:B box-type domain-containing protein n=1 Tax=Dreissena polymorpha TaxID=45954 RepID=A0A9D4FSI7_DREPO|nr:hypothetical protein DPMN_132457 [Dreissena polymorpha]